MNQLEGDTKLDCLDTLLHRFRYKICASCCHRGQCLSEASSARMAANQRTNRSRNRSGIQQLVLCILQRYFNASLLVSLYILIRGFP